MTTTIEKVAHPARIGDLLVIESERRDFYIGRPNTTRDECVVVEVASTFRDGRPKSVRHLDWSDAPPRPLAGWIGLKRVWLMEASAVNKPAVLDAVRAHRYPTNTDSPMIMPWDSLKELARLIAPHRTAKTGWRVAW